MISCTQFLSADLLEFTCPYEYPILEPIDKQKTIKQQISQIDEQIADLEKQKEMYLAKSARFQDLGDRLQFSDDYVTEARRYWDLSDCCMDIVKDIDIKITDLKIQKNMLLKNKSF